MTTALGVDVSTRRIAVGWVSSDGDVGAVSADVDPKLRGAQRLAEVRLAAWSAAAAANLRAGAPHLVVVEDANVGSATNKPLIQAVGVVLEALSDYPCPILELPIGTWKKLALGNGAAKKGAIWEGALAWGARPDNQDEADAVMIAVAGLRKLEQA